MRLALLSPLLLVAACDQETKTENDTGIVGTDGDADTDTDADADADADSDADTDADSDADTDADTDTDTGPEGDPVEGDLTGKAYVVNLADARIVEPPGIGSLLGSYLTQPILLGVVSATDDELSMIGALGVEGTEDQDYCLPSIDFPTADFSRNPTVAIGPTDVTLSIDGYDITLSQFAVAGTFTPDGSAFDDGVVGALIDTRPLDGIVGGGEGAICDLASGFGASCTACADGEDFCLQFLAEEVTGEETRTSLVEVAGTSCEGCEDGPPAPDAVCE